MLKFLHQNFFCEMGKVLRDTLSCTQIVLVFFSVYSSFLSEFNEI